MAINIDDIINDDYIKNLAEHVFNFKLSKIFAKNLDGNFVLFNYNYVEKHRCIEIYHHTDTDEFRVQIHFGLNTFCLSDFFTSNFKIFVESLKAQLPRLLEHYNFFDGTDDQLFLSKNFNNWKYGKNLPNIIEGFELFIRPESSLEITNGSFVIINYCDFAINSDFVIYYNVYRDDFGGELRLNGATIVLSEFDTDDLKTLESQLDEYLVKCLQRIRSTC